MTPSYDYRDEEVISRRREQRIESMRLEKEKQRRRRRLIRKLFPVAGIAIVVIVLIIILILALGKDKEPGTTGEQVTNDMLAGGSQGTVEQVNQPTTLPILPETTPLPTPLPTPAPAAYGFTMAEDAVTIYSEDVVSTNAILVDVSTDTIVAAKGAYEKLSPASMTKVLTVLVAAEHMTPQQLEDTFTIIWEVTDYAFVNDCSTVGFLNDEEVTVRDLLYGTILPSGGEAAVGLAYYIAGSQEAFVELMNEKLEELGLSDTAHFTNCVGLYDENHYCTLYDMAVIMRAALDNDLCREVLGAHSYTTSSTTQHPEGIVISNWFLRRIEDKETGGEVLCAKTGYVAESQNCAVSYGTFAGGTPYICVTAGSTSSWRCIYDQVEIYTRYVKQGNS